MFWSKLEKTQLINYVTEYDDLLKTNKHVNPQPLNQKDSQKLYLMLKQISHKTSCKTSWILTLTTFPCVIFVYYLIHIHRFPKGLRKSQWIRK